MENYTFGSMKTRFSNKCSLFITCLIFTMLAAQKSNGQFSLWKVSRHTLEAPESFEKDSVYFQIKQGDHLDHIAIFFINTTSDTLYFDRYDSRIFIHSEALGLSGKWVDIDDRKNLGCGVGHGKIALNPDSYFWIKRPKFRGDFSTKVRFILNTIDSSYYSQPISVQFNSNR